MHPQNGEICFVKPTNPAVKVQRGDGLYGQFLAPQGQECRWDDFLLRRLQEGAIQIVTQPEEITEEESV